MGSSCLTVEPGPRHGLACGSCIECPPCAGPCAGASTPCSRNPPGSAILLFTTCSTEMHALAPRTGQVRKPGRGGRHSLGPWDRTRLLHAFLRPDSGQRRAGLGLGQGCAVLPSSVGETPAPRGPEGMMAGGPGCRGTWVPAACRCSSFHQGALRAQLHQQAPRELRGGVQSSYSCPGAQH